MASPGSTMGSWGWGGIILGCVPPTAATPRHCPPHAHRRGTPVHGRGSKRAACPVSRRPHPTCAPPCMCLPPGMFPPPPACASPRLLRAAASVCDAAKHSAGLKPSPVQRATTGPPCQGSPSPTPQFGSGLNPHLSTPACFQRRDRDPWGHPARDSRGDRGTGEGHGSSPPPLVLMGGTLLSPDLSPHIL